MRDFDPPIIINCRDRVTPLRKLVAWLELAGHERIVLLDNASTYAPLLAYYRETPHTVVRLHRNCGSRALWAGARSGQIHDSLHLLDDWFVYTDPDIVPTEDCPFEAVDYLREALDAHPQFDKAGLGLYLADLSPDMPSLEWERSLVASERMLDARCYSSLVDTTFALYRPGSDFCFEAIRMGWPWQARHESPAWYGGDLTDENRYYLEHAEGANTANGAPLPGCIIGSSWKDAIGV